MYNNNYSDVLTHPGHTHSLYFALGAEWTVDIVRVPFGISHFHLPFSMARLAFDFTFALAASTAHPALGFTLMAGLQIHR